jgi:hypothetical protein
MLAGRVFVLHMASSVFKMQNGKYLVYEFGICTQGVKGMVI